MENGTRTVCVYDDDEAKKLCRTSPFSQRLPRKSRRRGARQGAPSARVMYGSPGGRGSDPGAERRQEVRARAAAGSEVSAPEVRVCSV